MPCRAIQARHPICYADTSTALTAAVERQRIVAEMTPGSPASAALAGYLVRLATVQERLGAVADALAGFREARVLLESIQTPSADELYDLAVSRAAISILANAMPGSAADQPAAEQATDAQAAVDALSSPSRPITRGITCSEGCGASGPFPR